MQWHIDKVWFLYIVSGKIGCLILCCWLFSTNYLEARGIYSNYGCRKNYGYLGENFTWPEQKKAAIVFTWDDRNFRSWRYINQIKPKDFPQTYFVIPRKKDKAKLKILKNSVPGTLTLNEIGSHSVGHPNFKRVSLRKVIWSITKAQTRIRNELDNFYPNEGDTLAYPYGAFLMPNGYNYQYFKVLHKIYIGARTTIGGLNNKGCFNPYYAKAININRNMRTIKKNIDKAIKQGSLIIFYGHGIKGLGGYKSTSKYHLKKIFSYVKQRQDELWVTTFSDSIHYLRKTNQIKTKP